VEKERSNLQEIWGSTAHNRRSKLKEMIDSMNRVAADMVDITDLSHFSTGAYGIVAHTAVCKNDEVSCKVTFKIKRRWLPPKCFKIFIRRKVVNLYYMQVTWPKKLSSSCQEAEQFYYTDAELLENAADRLAKAFIK
jgi:UTP-glucose-1-phosphate uridylyltransferase